MGLQKYRQKRSFDKTPEPTGGAGSKGKLLFVVQIHDASRLHYDFRLEMQGVLKSWAVPKGPSMDPNVKRLAMMVEDHPYDYKDFEGVIPKGNYGAGTVIVWDEGVYIPQDHHTGESLSEKAALQHLNKGKLTFTLQGKKLKGAFALIKSTGRGDNAWLLMKLKDRYASTTDILSKNKSAKSGKTIAQIAQHPDATWHSKRTKKNTPKTKATPLDELLQPARKSAMPKAVAPMLATLTDKPFDNANWLYEIKWDGYRAVAYLNNGKADILSRNQLSFNEKFAVIREALQQWKVRAVTDGEIVAINDAGSPDFQTLQNYFKHGKSARLIYYLFDLLWYEGKDLTHLPLLARKTILQQVLPADIPQLAYSHHVTEQGISFYKAAISKGLEGVIAKDCNSPYVTGRRTGNWLKVKHHQHTEAIICGYTKGRNSRKHFGAVILGKYKGNTLQYIGHTGSGFDEKTLKTLYQQFQPLITNRSPFKVTPATNMPATWLKPELVCEVKFAEITAEGILRQAIFLGLREDKHAANEKNVAVKPAPVTSLPEDEKQATLKVNHHLLKFTHLDKVYWPGEGITKGDMINYYASIADYILPYLKNRPQSLNRHPDGIKGSSFYQKNVEDKVASWITTFPYTSENDRSTKEFLVCKDKATLLYMANLGCIELHPWHSRISKPDYPDYCLIDLDPDGNSFNQVIDTALVLKEVLDSIGAASFVKTSGATGMHILLPLGARYTFEQSRMLAELIVHVVQKRLPNLTSTVRTPAKRKGKIYLDYLQNRQIQTMAAAYSLRPRPGAPVSAPLRWDEVKHGLKPAHFNIHNMAARLATEGDLLKGLLGKGINMRSVLKQLKELL
ncbi:DNA ligase D [Chitinophaga vietnamensis]|uniref:DNA ligase D n=1 Tax=Chitinophaga vietnamensis TaxID=2593957 RepID=UPI0011787E1A|nr:DNA ligase D [Chitinophaga vietnamensis]